MICHCLHFLTFTFAALLVGCADPGDLVVNIGSLRVDLPAEYELADYQPTAFHAAVSVNGNRNRELLIGVEDRGENKLKSYMDTLAPELDKTRDRGGCQWRWAVKKDKSGMTFSAMCEVDKTRIVISGGGPGAQWPEPARKQIFVALEKAVNE